MQYVTLGSGSGFRIRSYHDIVKRQSNPFPKWICFCSIDLSGSEWSWMAYILIRIILNTLQTVHHYHDVERRKSIQTTGEGELKHHRLYRFCYVHSWVGSSSWQKILHFVCCILYISLDFYKENKLIIEDHFKVDYYSFDELWQPNL